jgi:hypothetical protein
MEKLYRMAEIISSAVVHARIAIAKDPVKKEIFLKKEADQLPTELKGFVFTGDNWLWPVTKESIASKNESLYYDISASIAITERAKEGNITSCAMAPLGSTRGGWR